MRNVVGLGGWCGLWLTLLLAVEGFGQDDPQSESRKNPLPPGITDSQDPGDIPLSPSESLARMTVPKGFSIKLFASEPTIGQPIAFDFDDRGRLWVVECFSHPQWKPEGKDRVVILEDQDGDGSFDKRTVFWDQGRYLTGIAIGHGGVFLCNTPELIFLPDENRDDVPDQEPEVLLDGWTRRNHNNVINNLNFGPDGWLYGCIGNDAASNVGRPRCDDSERKKITRGIWRYHPYAGEFEVLALGAVNPWGFDWDDHGEAFFTNCVLPHLWHFVPGAYYERRPGEKDNPYVYERIQPIADHKHWATGVWTDSRGAHGEHGAKGGGHAHTGAMIYLGGAWPGKYRGTIFMGNIHGNRINNDWFERDRSGFVGRHGEDFLLGNNPWFRCLSQKYGPGGQVYISDWHDVGECHDDDGSHRSSGRIYKVEFDSAPDVRADILRVPGGALHSLGNLQLVDLHLHENEWNVRWARKLLHARASANDKMPAARKRLFEIFRSSSSVPHRLRALWTLYVVAAADQAFLLDALSDEHESIRAWALRLLFDRKQPSPSAIDQVIASAGSESSALVRLYLASTLQKIAPASPKRWKLGAVLAGRNEDQEDRRLQLMIWYGIEPLVVSDKNRAVELMTNTELPIIRSHIARRLAEALPTEN